MPQETITRRVQLLGTYEAALERVAGDPARSLSKDPDLLRFTYDRVEALLAAMPVGWTFDSTKMSCEEIIDSLAADLLPGRP